MVKIAKLTEISESELTALVAGYTSPAKYAVFKTESETGAQFSLEYVPLDPPYVKRFELDAELRERYPRVLAQGLSLGAYEDGKLVGIALAEHQAWSNALWVWEFHIAASHRGRGSGSKLMDSVIRQAQERDMRVVVCETQNTNMPAIRFYRRMGFEIEGIDLSYYTNNDVEEGEVAIFMKRKLG